MTDGVPMTGARTDDGSTGCGWLALAAVAAVMVAIVLGFAVVAFAAMDRGWTVRAQVAHLR